MKHVAGFSILEGVIAMGIASIAGLAVLSLTYESTKSGKNVGDLAAITAHQQFVIQSLGNSATCGALLEELSVPEFASTAVPGETVLAEYCGSGSGSSLTQHPPASCRPHAPSSTQPVSARLFTHAISPGQAFLQRGVLRGFQSLGGTGTYSAELALTYRTAVRDRLAVERRIPLVFSSSPGIAAGTLRLTGCGSVAPSSGSGAPSLEHVCTEVIGGEWDEGATPKCGLRKLAVAHTAAERAAGLAAITTQSGLFVNYSLNLNGNLNSQGSATFQGGVYANPLVSRGNLHVNGGVVFPGVRTLENQLPTPGMVLALRNDRGELMWAPASGGSAPPPSAAGSIVMGTPSTCPSGELMRGFQLSGNVLTAVCAAPPSGGSLVERVALGAAGGSATFTFQPNFVTVVARWSNPPGTPVTNSEVLVVRSGEGPRTIAFNAYSGNFSEGGFECATTTLDGSSAHLARNACWTGRVSGPSAYGYTLLGFDLIGYRR